MKIYFCGSIRGGREDAGLYAEIIGYISKKHSVLTEHVGDMKLSAAENPGDGDAFIYRRDVSWIEESDMVIAECTHPSLGVGYELAYAEKSGKPVHVFYNNSKIQLSAMIRGDRYFVIHPYTEKSEVFAELDRLL